MQGGDEFGDGIRGCGWDMGMKMRSAVKSEVMVRMCGRRRDRHQYLRSWSKSTARSIDEVNVDVEVGMRCSHDVDLGILGINARKKG